jgi:hypothetical protein
VGYRLAPRPQPFDRGATTRWSWPELSDQRQNVPGQHQARTDPSASGRAGVLADSGSSDPLSSRTSDRSDQSARKLRVMHRPRDATDTPHSPPTAHTPPAEISVRVEGPDR